VLPFVLTTDEWEPLASGLRQRARVLEAAARDLYGAQTLLTGGVLPAALLHKHPGYLRACHGVTPAGGVFLHLLAFDLARGPDGIWRVLGTRTQAASGAGYALENRGTISRIFPDAFRALQVQPLARFFEALQQMLLEQAPVTGEAPYVVLLTPGPYNETYFEHAFLAKQLGFPLVEGGDLTVRQHRVYLKTVDGLQRVHAILRRLDDSYCDPLELRADSTLGVPGLVHAWRSGQVLVANAFGTGVLESPALHAFLPDVCQRLLGEPLVTASLGTWWGGDGESDLLRHMSPDAAVLKPAFPLPSMEPVFLSDLDATAREAWSRRLEASPESFVVEEFLPLSQTPAWSRSGLVGRALMLRVFLASDGRGDYTVLPGGLARIAGDHRHIVSSQRGGSSKDAWIAGPAHAEPRPDGAAPEVRRRDDDEGEATTSSRVAEHLFWLGRYAERSENAARLLRAVLSRLPDADAFPRRLRPLVVSVCRQQGLLPPRSGDAADDQGQERAASIERALIDGLFDARGRHSLAFNVASTVRVAGAARDRLSSDNWRVLNQLHQSFAGRSGETVDLDEALDLIDRAIVSLVAVGGLEMAHMTRNHGWRFLSIGRHLERLSFVAATLAAAADPAAYTEPALLTWLLDLSDSLITYRTRHRHHPEWTAVVGLLLFDAHNPRAGVFQLSKLAKHVRQLPGADADLGELVAGVDRVLARCTTRSGAQGELFDRPAPLAALLADCQELSSILSDALTLRYFSHVYELAHLTVTS
jgi:uncharacterized circularly permuted ATP-grasp superfamily protein/uncharacterized alpha-E superfamily protein